MVFLLWIRSKLLGGENKTVSWCFVIAEFREDFAFWSSSNNNNHHHNNNNNHNNNTNTKTNTKTKTKTNNNNNNTNTNTNDNKKDKDKDNDKDNDNNKEATKHWHFRALGFKMYTNVSTLVHLRHDTQAPVCSTQLPHPAWWSASGAFPRMLIGDLLGAVGPTPTWLPMLTF